MAILKKTAKAEQAVAETAVKSPVVEQAPAAVKGEKPASKTTRKASVKNMGKELSQEDMVAAVKAQWTGADIKTLDLYVKPEDSAVYYVINGESTGKIEL